MHIKKTTFNNKQVAIVKIFCDATRKEIVFFVGLILS